VIVAAAAQAANPPIDRERAALARAVAARYWVESGLDKLPASYDHARFERAVRGEDDPYNIVAGIAVATLSANPGREDAALKYLNEALLPYALSHKAQYLCLVSEVFYNSQSTPNELRGLAKSSHSSEGVAIAFIEYAFFLIKTQTERERLDLKIPADEGIPEAVGAFGKTLRPQGGALVPDGTVRLGCD
jgi:hypothetical protein